MKKPEIKVAESAGFCFGVDRAVKLVYDEISRQEDKVATLGPIIHNADVVNDLKSKGVRTVGSVSELEEGEKAVIRSHGVGKSVYDELAEKGNPYIDATCPFVARIHTIVSEKTKEGYYILIAGDKNHPEVQGIVGHCDENSLNFRMIFITNNYYFISFLVFFPNFFMNFFHFRTSSIIILNIICI